MSSTTQSGPGGRATNWAGVLFGVALGVLAAYQQFKLPPVLPVLLERYRYDPVLAGGLMSIYALVGMALSVHAGHLVRRHGALPYLLGAVAVTLAGNLLGLALPESGWAMLAARGLEGAGAAVLVVCMAAFVNYNSSPRHLPMTIAIQATWIPIGQIAATLAARPVVAEGGWTPIWWLGIAATVALAAWTLGLAQSGRVDMSLGTASVPAGHAAPLTSRERRLLVAGAVLFGIWSVQFTAYMTWLPVYLVDVHGLSADRAALGYLIPVVVLLLFNLVTGLLLRAGLQVLPVLVAALVLQAAVWLLVPVTGGGAWGIASLVVWGVAAGISPTCLWALPAALVGSQRATAPAFGITMAGRNLGVFVGPLALAFTIRLTDGWNLIAILLGLSTLAAGAMALVLRRAGTASA